jgi:DNA repair exonuclease SbcCD ATPase subunit
MKTYKCPVCGSELSKERYQHALGIVDAQEKAIEAERAEIGRERERLKTRIAEARTVAQSKALERRQRLVQGKERIIQNLKETVHQLQRGTTPQTKGWSLRRF